MTELHGHDYLLTICDLDEKKLRKSVNGLYQFSDFSLRKFVKLKYLDVGGSYYDLVVAELRRRRRVRLVSFKLALRKLEAAQNELRAYETECDTDYEDLSKDPSKEA